MLYIEFNFIIYSATILFRKNFLLFFLRLNLKFYKVTKISFQRRIDNKYFS